MIRNLALIALLLLTIFSSRVLLAQDSVTYRHYNYKQAGITIKIIDSLIKYDDSTFVKGDCRMMVKKGSKAIFDGSFLHLTEKPNLVRIDSETNAFLFTVWSGGAHCCTTLFLAINDSTGFNIADTLFLRDGDYKLCDLNGDGKPELLATIDYFPYCWTSFAGSDFDLTIYSISNSALRNETKNYPDLVEKNIRGYLKDIRGIKPHITEEEIDASLKEDESEMPMNQINLGELKQKLACLLVAYTSMDSADEGWRLVEKQYPYKGRERFFAVLKRETEERMKPFKPRLGE